MDVEKEAGSIPQAETRENVTEQLERLNLTEDKPSDEVQEDSSK